ncbi:NAD(P)H-hydrate dehydratase [Fontibacter flavus]|uniref:Bifunctional NAD(P)H-hydrate repair enzyme n=1 Tax=Fontibacter flavus TaxID=654838 RepID=A0ABV6FWY7_9BACT
MLSIIPGNKISSLDSTYIKEEGISSWDLMERAASAFCNLLFEKLLMVPDDVFIFSGPGNNGGDGLAIARLLSLRGKKVSLIVFEQNQNCSKDYQINFEKLPSQVQVFRWDEFGFAFNDHDLIIDGIFGVGINRPVEGKYREVIEKLNEAKGIKIAIDIPSGIPSDSLLIGIAFKADYTFTFQFPKLALLFPEHAEYSGVIEVADIGIPDHFLEQFGENRYFLTGDDLKSLHLTFNRFSHKGDYGKVLLIGGSKGKVGAVLLASKAALRTGSGLVFALVPEDERLILQIGAPEVILANQDEIKGLQIFDALGVGPGWGQEIDISFYESLLKRYHKPLVIDADGLNLLSAHPRLIELVPNGSILTPHIKEFERMTGKVDHHLDRLQKARDFSEKHNVYLVLKGQFTSITCPDGRQFFNSSGNQYMATAGSGDVLTGMVTSFLGQGYPPLNAALCAVYHHGLAGELASETRLRGTIAGDIIESIPASFLKLGIA